MASGSITSWEIDGEIVETVLDFILGGGAPKSLQMVIVAMKLKVTPWKALGYVYIISLSVFMI